MRFLRLGLVAIIGCGLLACMREFLREAASADGESPAAQQKSDKLEGQTDPNDDYSDELPRIPPRETKEALKSFKLVPGFRMELAVAEPLLTDPVAAAFDERGRLFTVGMKDYSEQAEDFLGEVRLLTDEDGNGNFDKSTVYAEKLSWPTAITCWNGGVFVGAAPDIWYFKDTDGDGAADERRKVFTGFGRGNVQGLINSFQWGLDNRIHGSTSSAGGDVRCVLEGHESEPVNLNGRDFSFDPHKFDLRSESGGGQHGMCFDDWGRKFVCSNSSHIELVLFEDRYLRRNPHVPAPSPRKMIAADGGQAEVFRISPVEPWRLVRTRLRVAGSVPGPIEGGGRASGYFTSATGITIYRGDAWPRDLAGIAIVGDVGSNIIHRKKLTARGVELEAARIDEGKEFCASEDNWFRPVQFLNGPDGCLYVLDMYREVIEHPASLPPPIKKHLDLTSGRDRGRVYRIVPDKFERRVPPRFDEASTAELVQTLAHPNAWQRETAARLLYQRRDAAAPERLRRLANDSESPLGRIHAIYALRGYEGLTAEDVIARLQDDHPRVREHAVRLAEALAAESREVRESLGALYADDDARVRYQLAFTLGEVSADTPARNAALAKLAKRDGGDPWMRLAILSSLASGAGDVFAELAADAEYRASDSGRAMFAALAGMIGAQSQSSSLTSLLKSVETFAKRDSQLAGAVLRELAAGMGKSGDPLREALGSTTASASRLLDILLRAARKTAVDEMQTPADRAEAAHTLAVSSFTAERELLASLLNSSQPQEVQLAALAAISRFADEGVGELVLAGWASYSPGLRAAATDVLFARVERLNALLNALESGVLKPQDLDPARIALLRAHGDEKLRQRAAELLADVKLARRDDVVKEYLPALNLVGDLARGREVFKKSCAKCHKVEDIGVEIGPSLAAMKARGAEAILLNVLDPSREVNPQYVNYLLQTKDGNTYTGLIAAETSSSVTLRRAENQSDTVLRSNIDVLASTGLSIMPEGLEKEVDRQALADLIAFLLGGPH